MAYIPKLHCHSSFEHYEMYHANRSSGYGNSVFNTTYNFNGGTICGGGFWGGLFGGLGMGLGAGLMSWLGGGMFGGGMGMFGGGFPMMNMWGGGFPFMNWWGGGGVSDGAGGRNINTHTTTSTTTTNTNTNTNERVVEKEITDRDVAVLKDLEKEIQALEQKGKDGTLTQTEIDTLKKKVEEEASKSDKYHKTEHDEHYQLLLKRLNDLKPKPDPDPDPDPDPNPDDAIKVALHFAKHSGSKINDQYIRGDIVGVKIGADGKTPVGYIIDCTNSDGDYKLKYEVTVNGNIYSIKCISTTHNTNNCQKTLYTSDKPKDFKKDEHGDLVRLNDDGEPLVSEHRKEGLNVQIEYSEEVEDFVLPPGYEDVDEDGEAEINGKKIKVETEGTI